MGRRLGDVIVPLSLRDAHSLGMARYLATGNARVIGRRVEMTAMRADGAEFPVELTITRIVSDGPPSFTGYLRDITDRRTWEENLRRSEAYLAKAQTLSRTGSFGWKVATEEHFWSDETFRGRVRTERRREAVRGILHHQDRRHGDRTVSQPLDHREPSWPPVGDGERWVRVLRFRSPSPALQRLRPSPPHR